jgi:hypothetical protein
VRLARRLALGILGLPALLKSSAGDSFQRTC